MAKILNIETSTRICSVSLGDGAKILASREQRDTFEHAKILHPYITEILSEAGLDYPELDAVAVSEGPGSYTGLRIGVSAAKGICYSQDIPLIAISTLQAMVMHAIDELNPTDGLLAPMIDARRQEVYTAVFDGEGSQVKPVAAEIINQNSLEEYSKAKKVFYFGDGAEKCRNTFQQVENMRYHEGGFPSAAYMNTLAQGKYNAGDFVDVAYFEPFYLKDFIAGTPKVKGLK
ncbi:MAG: tRNA (adenosine(37)-N6)-threonylcarbamoyltransferase complex dimerization subunit type 1 TsaB [Bacteroidales bacterium]|nr:tRNA (adenosine(37)-N6)-threonylcarbamoyltransferase complex dimerization subunit type 1 TsaB [Bacteroidales bacterium]MCF8327475.1 tRNA (adenosine(37)-N6)-threonylcarbamoyltransferase complex dimerization subunit type 1 TsaB [Bacteroidales bacterium]